jgi:hypothetical protein
VIPPQNSEDHYFADFGQELKMARRACDGQATAAVFSNTPYKQKAGEEEVLGSLAGSDVFFTPLFWAVPNSQT